MSDAVVVYSGGLDSTVVLANAIKQYKTVSAISFNYGAKHNKQELIRAVAFCKKNNVLHRVIDLTFMNELFSSTLLQSGEEVPDGEYYEDSMRSTVVPFRNGIMLSIAVGYAESINASNVLLGSHQGDHHVYPDCRPEFNEAIAKAANVGTYINVNVIFPYEKFDKKDIADEGRQMGIDFTQTWTCYKGHKIHCGVCGACNERKYALRFDEGLDMTEYEN